MKISDRLVLIVVAIVGVVSFTIPWIVEAGFSWQTFRLVCVNFGTGVLASVLVLALTRMIASRGESIASVPQLVRFLRGETARVTPAVASDVEALLNLGTQLRQLGVLAAYQSREDAYPDIAKEMKEASRIQICTGSLHSFWSLHRELMLSKDKENHSELRVALLKPGSAHAAVRAALDTGATGNSPLLRGYSATIQQVHRELKHCALYDFCPPASVWILDEVAYVSPYFYAMRGGQGLCLKIRRTGSGLFESVNQSVGRLMADVRS